MKLLLVSASLLVAVGCTSKQTAPVPTETVAISPTLGMSVESARSHVRSSGETRVLVIWRLYNTSDQMFDLQAYESDEFHLLSAADIGYPTNISLGTNAQTLLAPKTGVTMLSSVDLPAGVSTAGMRFGPVYADKNAQGDQRNFLPVVIHDEFTSCDKLAEICDAPSEAVPAYCEPMEGQTYPLAYPLTRAADEGCKDRLAQAQSAQAQAN